MTDVPFASPLVLDAVILTLPSAAGPVEILRGVDLTVAPGERVAIVGPSGSGKSSLIAVGAGLEEPTGGTARLFGEDLAKLDEDGRALLRRGRAALVFQSFHLLPSLTALDNVALLEIAGARDALATARDWLGRVGLAGRLTHYPHQLSGGEQQRVALARALAARPALLFADEPTGNLDGATATSVANLMFGRVAEVGAARVRRCCWPMNPPAIWTVPMAARSWIYCSPCATATAPPLSWSPMTQPWRRAPTGSCAWPTVGSWADGDLPGSLGF